LTQPEQCLESLHPTQTSQLKQFVELTFESAVGGAWGGFGATGDPIEAAGDPIETSRDAALSEVSLNPTDGGPWLAVVERGGGAGPKGPPGAPPRAS